MAIAFDNATDGGNSAATSLTFSHTCAGSNLILFVATQGIVAVGDNVTSITYNGVGLTKINSIEIPSDRVIDLWYLIAPDSGSNSVVVNFSGNFCTAVAASYTGAKQSGQPDNSGVNTGTSATTYAQALTTIADNCWVIGNFGNQQRQPTAGASTVSRVGDASGIAILDNNAAQTPAGSVTLNANSSVAGTWAAVMASIAPFTAVTASKSHLLPLMGIGI